MTALDTLANVLEGLEENDEPQGGGAKEEGYE